MPGFRPALNNSRSRNAHIQENATRHDAPLISEWQFPGLGARAMDLARRLETEAE
jgi:hypothetical protein